MSKLNFLASAETPGVCAIWWGDDDAPFYDPVGNIARVKFHSGLRYFEAFYRQYIDLTLPEMTTGSARDVVHALPDHGAGVIPFTVVMVDGAALDPLRMVYDDYNNGAYRTLTPELTETGMGLREYGYNNSGHKMAEMKIGVDVVCFRPSIEGAADYAFRCRPNTGELSIGRLSAADTQFVRVVTSGDYLGWLPKPGSNIDMIEETIRIVTPDGVAHDYNGYVPASPAFTGPGAWKAAL